MILFCTRLWLASDHRGVDLKQILQKKAHDLSLVAEDLGPKTSEPVDYPLYAHRLAERMGPDDGGVLICASGIGMSMAANRYPHLRGALCHTPDQAQRARQHNNANVLILGADSIECAQAETCLLSFLATPFEGGRHQARVEALNDLASPFWSHLEISQLHKERVT